MQFIDDLSKYKHFKDINFSITRENLWHHFFPPNGRERVVATINNAIFIMTKKQFNVLFEGVLGHYPKHKTFKFRLTHLSCSEMVGGYSKGDALELKQEKCKYTTGVDLFFKETITINADEYTVIHILGIFKFWPFMELELTIPDLSPELDK